MSGFRSLVSTRRREAAISAIAELVKQYTAESFDIESDFDENDMKHLVEKVTQTKETVGIQCLSPLMEDLHTVSLKWFVMACVRAPPVGPSLGEAQVCSASAGHLHHILCKTEESSNKALERKKAFDLTTAIMQVAEVMEESKDHDLPDHLCIQLLASRTRAVELSEGLADCKATDPIIKQVMAKMLKERRVLHRKARGQEGEGNRSSPHKGP